MRAAARWEDLLDELECRLEQWQIALDGDGPYPDAFSWPEGLGPCPEALVPRARRIDAAQRDVRDRLTLRQESLGALLRTEGRVRGAAPVPLFVDQHS